MAAPEGNAPARRGWIGRLLAPLALALFAAMLCAGPGAVVVPATMQLAAPLVCPAGTTLQQNERPGTDSGEAVVYVTLECAGAEGASPASVNGVFAVLAVIYFVIFGIAAVAGVAVFMRRASGHYGRPTRPVPSE